MTEYQENTDQLSVSNYFHDEREMLKEYAHMLHEDLHLGIAYSEKDKLKVELAPENKTFEKMLFNSVNLRYSRNNLVDFVWGLVDEISQAISYNGITIYEFVKSKDIKNAFYLKHIPGNYKVKIKKNDIIQFMPEVMQKEGFSKKIIIPRSKCFIFEFPQKLGGYSKYLKTLNYIQKYGGIMSFASLELSKLAGKFDDYDLLTHQKLKDYDLWKKTSYINWHHRAYNNKDYGLEHYRYARAIKFRKTLIMIRDSIIESMQEMIGEISKEIVGTKLNLKISGYIEMKEIDQAILNWYDGKLGFDEISKYT